MSILNFVYSRPSFQKLLPLRIKWTYPSIVEYSLTAPVGLPARALPRIRLHHPDLRVMTVGKPVCMKTRRNVVMLQDPHRSLLGGRNHHRTGRLRSRNTNVVETQWNAATTTVVRTRVPGLPTESTLIFNLPVLLMALRD